MELRTKQLNIVIKAGTERVDGTAREVAEGRLQGRKDAFRQTNATGFGMCTHQSLDTSGPNGQGYEIKEIRDRWRIIGESVLSILQASSTAVGTAVAAGIPSTIAGARDRNIDPWAGTGCRCI